MRSSASTTGCFVAEPIRVLHVLHELRASGAETMLYTASARFRELGVRCDIVCAGDTLGDYAPRLREAGYGLYHLPMRPAVLFFPRLLRLLREHSYDVLHIHTEAASFWTACTSLLAGTRSIVRTVHSTFEFKGELRWRRMLQRRTLDAAGVRFVAVSSSVASNEAVRFGVEATVVPNWFDSRAFRPPSAEERTNSRIALGIPESKRVVVTVGNCSAVKRHGDVLRALARIPVHARPIYLHVGGEDASGSERALAASLGVAEQVMFAGRLEDVRQALWAADLYVMPSSFEGFSIAALEALAVGLSCVLRDVPGLRELGPAFPTVRLVRSEDELVAAMSHVERVSVDELQAARARELFGIERGVDQYARLYASLSGAAC